MPWSLRPEFEQPFRKPLSDKKKKRRNKRKEGKGKGKERKKRKDGCCVSLWYIFIQENSYSKIFELQVLAILSLWD